MRLVAADIGIDRGGRRILSDVSFELVAGAMAVTGRNGAGKSSLLRVLAGLLRPAAGRITIEPDASRGHGADDVPLHYLGHRNALKPHLSARENLAFAAGFLGGDFRSGGADPRDALAAWGLEAAADTPVAWLSAGQTRRVALARLLVVPRPLWLLDEPSTGLDAGSLATFERLARAHLAGGGLIVAATHGPLAFATCELRLGDCAPQ